MENFIFAIKLTTCSDKLFLPYLYSVNIVKIKKEPVNNTFCHSLLISTALNSYKLYLLLITGGFFMLTFTNDFTQTDYYHFPHIDAENILYFDIETTGFSVDTSSLYLIGCCYKKGKQFHFIQWFADTYDSEAELLHAFFQFMNNFSVLVHFNGNTFDIPYLEKKCAQYSLPYNFSSIQSIDIYKKVSPYRKNLSFKNLKLKTIENFLSITRKDGMDGKKLIKLYGTYMQERFKNKNPEKIEELQNILLLHNQEDVQNLPMVSSFLSYIDLFESLPEIIDISFFNKEHIRLSNKISMCDINIPDYCCITFTVPERFSLLRSEDSFFYTFLNNNYSVTLSFDKTTATLTLPVIHDTLKYYYPNYKDYFYLPKEDRAIHKSVGIYVEKEYRRKATTDTAYIKQTGLFLPQLEAVFHPFFQYQKKDKLSFFEISETLLSHKNQFHTFLLKWWTTLLLKR